MARTTEVRYQVSPDVESLGHSAAKYLSEQIELAVQARGVARVALSGGKTPKRMLQVLSDPQLEYRRRVPWSAVEIYFVDERAVPPEDAESNYGMVRVALLDRVPIPAPQILRIQGELTPEAAAARYESEIRTRFRLEGAELPRFDVVALGMGEDGHTASLFPCSEAIDALGRIAVENQLPHKDIWRITLTWPVLNQAREVFFLISGADKADVLHRVLLGTFNPEQLPSQLIRPASGRLTMFLDTAAAALLPAIEADGSGRLERTQ